MAVSPSNPGTSTATASGGDPSMEEILASIRRILNEDDPAAQAPAEPRNDDVLVLDTSMLVSPPSTVAGPVAVSPASAAPEAELAVKEESAAPEQPLTIEPPSPPPVAEPPAELSSPAEEPTPPLVAPDTAAATAAALGSLVRTLAADRRPQVWSNGPTLEDLVRAELRPLLKAWLDAHLPPIVERLVRAEIERVVGRAIP